MKEPELRAILRQYGVIKRIHFEALESIDAEAPQREVSQLIMRKKYLFPPRNYHGSDHGSDTESIASMSSVGSKISNFSNPNGDTQDFSHLTASFVVFESQSQATKCVKHRVRAVDGMRAIHKYDYNKVAKKYRIAKMKGERLRFSPPPANQMNNQYNSGGGGGSGYHRSNRSASPIPSKYRQQIHNRDGGRKSSSPRGYQSYRSQPNMVHPQPVNNRFSGAWNGRGMRGSPNRENRSNSNTPTFRATRTWQYNGGGNESGSPNRQKQQSPESPKRHRLGSRKDRSSYDNSKNNQEENGDKMQKENAAAPAPAKWRRSNT